MNVKTFVFRLADAFHDNSGLIVLAVCIPVAVLFMSLIFMPRYFRRMRRALRRKKRGVQAPRYQRGLTRISSTTARGGR